MNGDASGYYWNLPRYRVTIPRATHQGAGINTCCAINTAASLHHTFKIYGNTKQCYRTQTFESRYISGFAATLIFKLQQMVSTRTKETIYILHLVITDLYFILLTIVTNFINIEIYFQWSCIYTLDSVYKWKNNVISYVSPNK